MYIEDLKNSIEKEDTIYWKTPSEDIEPIILTKNDEITSNEYLKHVDDYDLMTKYIPINELYVSKADAQEVADLEHYTKTGELI